MGVYAYTNKVSNLNFEVKRIEMIFAIRTIVGREEVVLDSLYNRAVKK